jgi:hypothetical protein
MRIPETGSEPAGSVSGKMIEIAQEFHVEDGPMI